MDTTVYKSYSDQLAKQQSDLEAYITDKTAAISIPADKNALNEGKKNFLTKSGCVFIIIGIIATIAGLIVKVPGIWISGLTAIACGVYVIIKGKQQLLQEAYDAVGSGIEKSADSIVAYVSKTWTDFVTAQNADLRKTIIGSDLSVDAKTEATGRVLDTAFYHVDMPAIDKDVDAVDATEKIDAYKAYLPKLQSALLEALNLSVRAQSDIYDAVTKISQPKSNPAAKADTASATAATATAATAAKKS